MSLLSRELFRFLRPRIYSHSLRNFSSSQSSKNVIDELESRGMVSELTR